jgi:hypothetical protein
MPELKKKRWRTTLQRSRRSRQRSACSARYPRGIGTASIVSSGLPNPTQQVLIQKMCAKLPLLSPGWEALPFENTSRPFFEGRINPLRI